MERFIPACAGNTYDTKNQNLLYILPSISDPRKMRVAVEPQFWLNTERHEINAIRSAAKVPAADIAGKI